MTVNVWISYMCTVVEETNIEVIFAAMNTTELVVKIRPGKLIQARTGFEPMTSAIPIHGLNFFFRPYFH